MPANKHIPLLTSLMEGQDRFLSLIAVREFIHSTNTYLPSMLALGEKLFGYAHTLSQNESFLNLLAECIGNIVSLDHAQSQVSFLSKGNH